MPAVREPRIVLVAEDDPTFIGQLSERLRAQGCHLIEPSSRTWLREWLTAVRGSAVPIEPTVLVSHADALSSALLATRDDGKWKQPVVLMASPLSPSLKASAGQAGIAVILERPPDAVEACAVLVRLVRRPD